jgi:hypothetical protein
MDRACLKFLTSSAKVGRTIVLRPREQTFLLAIRALWLW